MKISYNELPFWQLKGQSTHQYQRWLWGVPIRKQHCSRWQHEVAGEAVRYYCLCPTSMQLMKEEENDVLHFFPYSLQDSFVSQYIQQHVYRPEIIEWLFYFTFNFCFILKYSSLTMLCRFQVYGQVIQLYIYMHLFFIKFFSHLKITISQLLHGIEQSSLCYTIGPCWFSILSFLLECNCFTMH